MKKWLSVSACENAKLLMVWLFFPVTQGEGQHLAAAQAGPWLNHNSYTAEVEAWSWTCASSCWAWCLPFSAGPWEPLVIREGLSGVWHEGWELFENQLLFRRH